MSATRKVRGADIRTMIPLYGRERDAPHGPARTAYRRVCILGDVLAFVEAGERVPGRLRRGAQKVIEELSK